MPTVVIAPFNVANYPEGGGHFWVYMQYVLGLRQLGCEVYWLEEVRTRGRGDRIADNLMTFRSRLRRYGLDGHAILYRAETGRTPTGSPQEYFGVTRDKAETIFERADLLLNFHYSMHPGLLSRFRHTALVDIDPGLLQFWMSRRQLRVPRHDFYFTIAEGTARASGSVALDGMEWTHIRPPICLERWRFVFDAGCRRFTSVSTWDSSDWVVDEREKYENSKRIAFMRFADLPRLTDQPLELALVLRSSQDTVDRKDLEQRGWSIQDAREVASTPEMYQGYIHDSRGEFSCAKPSYVRLKTAWISDRTICYLASGKPVVVQDTGPSDFLPNGEGMFRFTTARQAAEAFEAINANYEHHCRAARRLAETYFDARQITGDILNATIGFEQHQEGTALISNTKRRAGTHEALRRMPS